MSADLKRKQIRKYYIIIFGISYILFVLYVIHVMIIHELDPTIGGAEAMSLGLDDMLAHPFRIFPVPPSTWSLVFVVTLVIGFAVAISEAQHRLKKHYNPKESFGNAHWLSGDDLLEYQKKFTEPFGEARFDGTNNIILSKEMYMSLDNRAINRNMNILLIGGSGAGKSFMMVGPNILQANCSFVITDPSGGLFNEYGAFLEYSGYIVKCFNLEHMNQGNHYNPFRYIESDKDIEILVTTLISNTTPPDKKGGDPFWDSAESLLLMALIAYLYHQCTEDLQNFTAVMELMRLAQIDENDSTSKSPLDSIFDKVAAEDPDAYELKKYQEFKSGAGKTLASILISCMARLKSFDLTDVAELTSSDDIDLDTIGDVKTALFIIIPTGEKTYNFLASLMYSQLFQRLYGYCQNEAQFSQIVMDGDSQVWKTFRAKDPDSSEKARIAAEAFLERAKKATIVKNEQFGWYELRTERGEMVGYRGSKEEAEKSLKFLQKGKVIPNSKQSNGGRRLSVHCRFLMDEFANTGKIPEFSEKVSTIRKYEISTMIVLQSITQIQLLFEKDWSTITGNCDNTIYLGGGADIDTQKWLADLLGKETRTIMSTSYQAGSKGGSTSFQQQGVELLAAAELRTLREDECIVIQKSTWPYKGKKYIPLKHKNWNLKESLGKYFYNPAKTEELVRAFKPEDVKSEIVKRHGSIREMTSDEKNELDAKNEQVKQAARECRENMSESGKPVISSPEDIDTNSESSADSLGITDEKDAQARIDEMISDTDASWNDPSIDISDEAFYASLPAGA